VFDFCVLCNRLVVQACVLFRAPSPQSRSANVVVSQGYSDLKERMLEDRLSEWGVTVESFVELCEQALKRDHDPRADRILGNILEYSDFQQFAEMMEKRNVDLQVCVQVWKCMCVQAAANRVACTRSRPALFQVSDAQF
jgi:hypothetical protein